MHGIAHGDRDDITDVWGSLTQLPSMFKSSFGYMSQFGQLLYSPGCSACSSYGTVPPCRVQEAKVSEKVQHGRQQVQQQVHKPRFPVFQLELACTTTLCW